MRRFLFVVASLYCICGSAALGQVCTDPQAAPAVVEIDGVKWTLADLEQKRPALFQARSGFYQVQRKSVDELIDEHLLEKQAKKEGVSVAQLLDRHINGALPGNPSEEALRVYYEGLDTAESFDAVRGKIIEHLRQRRIAKARAAYLQKLRDGATIAIRLAPPRAEIALADTPVRGRRGAPVVLVEYADYECTYCQQIQPALDRLLAEYKDRIAFVYKDSPLPMHTNAQKASEAAHCAGAQGKYWEYHDLLMSTKEFEVSKLKQRARELDLNGGAFDSCLDSGAKADIVQAHLAEAQKLGLQGTPSFFINGRFFSGIMPYEKLRDIVEEELRAAPVAARNNAGS